MFFKFVTQINKDTRKIKKKSYLQENIPFCGNFFLLISFLCEIENST